MSAWLVRGASALWGEREMVKQICGTCHWCGERARKQAPLPREGWLRCELFPRSSYLGLITETSGLERERLLDALGKPTTVDWTCAGWERRSPPDAPPRRVRGI